MRWIGCRLIVWALSKSIMSPEQFLQLAAKRSLAHIGREILSTSLPAIRVLEEALRDAKPDEMTYLGGAPSPMPSRWPTYEETRLTFIGQVDTKWLPPDVCSVSVPEGILQFFVPLTSETTNYEPSLECGRVLFHSSGRTESESDEDESSIEQEPTEAIPEAVDETMFARFVRLFRRQKVSSERQSKEASGVIFPKRSFDWEIFPSLYESAPDRDSLWLPEHAEEFDFNHDKDWDNYFEFRREVIACPQSNWLAQMFGFANELREDMQPLVDLASGHRSVNEFHEWVLLFSLNGSCGGTAPDAACYYFWIHRDVCFFICFRMPFTICSGSHS